MIFSNQLQIWVWHKLLSLTQFARVWHAASWPKLTPTNRQEREDIRDFNVLILDTSLASLTSLTHLSLFNFPKSVMIFPANSKLEFDANCWVWHNLLEFFQIFSTIYTKHYRFIHKNIKIEPKNKSFSTPKNNVLPRSKPHSTWTYIIRVGGSGGLRPLFFPFPSIRFKSCDVNYPSFSPFFSICLFLISPRQTYVFKTPACEDRKKMSHLAFTPAPPYMRRVYEIIIFLL